MGLEEKRRPEDRHDEAPLVLASPVISNVLAELIEALNFGEDVLLRGPSGAGKTSLARIGHARSCRRDGPFIYTCLADVPDTLAQSEFSGHLKGSFSEAQSDRLGLFRAAHSGTIMTDEIDKGSLPLQGVFLRFLDDRGVKPIGADKPVRVDVAFIAATNRDLEKEVEERRFLGDLLFRLSKTVIYVPPLSERREDIRPLIEYYSGVYAKERGKPPPRIERPAMDLFEESLWPGNVRGLQGAVLHCVKCAAQGVITAEIARSAPGVLAARCDSAATRLAALRTLPYEERRTKPVLLEALQLTRWNKTEAADALGIPLRTFMRDCKKNAITP